MNTILRSSFRIDGISDIDLGMSANRGCMMYDVGCTMINAKEYALCSLWFDFVEDGC